ncbi:MAG: hypothetical protein LBC41_13730, partial [Clostridiales bacterium]|nr:hypothetical protein [Clostridiales bacterium]
MTYKARLAVAAAVALAAFRPVSAIAEEKDLASDENTVRTVNGYPLLEVEILEGDQEALWEIDFCLGPNPEQWDRFVIGEGLAESVKREAILWTVYEDGQATTVSGLEMSWIAPDTIGWTLSDSAEHAFADLKDKEMSIRLRARMDPVLASSADGVLGGTYINCYKDHILVNRNKSYNGAASAGASTKFDPVDLFVPTDPPPEPDGAWLTAPQEMPSFLKSENLEPAQEFEPKATEYGQEPVDAIEHFSGSITDEAPPADDIDESSTSYTGEDAGDGLGPYDAAIQAYEPEVIQLSDQSQADQYNQNVAGQGPANQAEELTEITPSATPPPPPGDPVISYSTAEPVPAKEAYPYNQPKTEAQKETKASVPRPGIKAVVSSRGKPVSRSAPASLDEEIDVGIEANLGDLSAGNAIEINCIFDPALEYAGAKFTGISEENWVIEPKNGSVSFMCLESTRKLSGKTLNIKTRLRLKDNIAHSLLNKDDPL